MTTTTTSSSSSSPTKTTHNRSSTSMPILVRAPPIQHNSLFRQRNSSNLLRLPNPIGYLNSAVTTNDWRDSTNNSSGNKTKEVVLSLIQRFTGKHCEDSSTHDTTTSVENTSNLGDIGDSPVSSAHDDDYVKYIVDMTGNAPFSTNKTSSTISPNKSVLVPKQQQHDRQSYLMEQHDAHQEEKTTDSTLQDQQEENSPTSHSWQVLEDWMARLELRLLSTVQEQRRRSGKHDLRHRSSDSSDSPCDEVGKCLGGIQHVWEEMPSTDGAMETTDYPDHQASMLLKLLLQVLRFYSHHVPLHVNVMKLLTQVWMTLSQASSSLLDAQTPLVQDIVAAICRSMDCHDYCLELQSSGTRALYHIMHTHISGCSTIAVTSLFTTLCEQGAVVLFIQAQMLFEKKLLLLGSDLETCDLEDKKKLVTTYHRCNWIMGQMHSIAQSYLAHVDMQREQVGRRSHHRQSWPLQNNGPSPFLASKRLRRDRRRRGSHMLRPCLSMPEDTDNEVIVQDDIMDIHSRLVVLRLAEWAQAQS